MFNTKYLNNRIIKIWNYYDGRHKTVYLFHKAIMEHKSQDNWPRVKKSSVTNY